MERKKGGGEDQRKRRKEEKEKTVKLDKNWLMSYQYDNKYGDKSITIGVIFLCQTNLQLNL